MTALAFNQQIDNHGRRGGGAISFAAACRGYRPAGPISSRRQEHDGEGSRSRVFIVSSLNSPGLRARRSFRVGWCFNTTRDFLEFHALTRAGIRPDHAAALLGTPSPQTLRIEPSLPEPIADPMHQERPSKVTVAMTYRDRIEGQKIGIRGQNEAS